MGTITVSASAPIAASAELVYRLIADDAHHAQFLPAAISDFRVLEGGVGAGTVHSFTLTAGKRRRPYVMTVAEPAPGRVLTETDSSTSLVTTFTVTPAGDTCTVEILTTWQGASGIGGFFERTFAPGALRKIYVEELGRLDAYASTQVS